MCAARGLKLLSSIHILVPGDACSLLLTFFGFWLQLFAGTQVIGGHPSGWNPDSVSLGLTLASLLYACHLTIWALSALDSAQSIPLEKKSRNVHVRPQDWDGMDRACGVLEKRTGQETLGPQPPHPAFVM